LSGRQAKQALGVAASGRSALALYGTDDSAQRGLGDALRITAELRRLPAFATLVDTAPERAFDAVRSRAEPLPVWRGGVPSSARARPPTSRTLEGELLATELFATIDTATYPAAVLERAWHVLLEGGADAADEEVWAAVRDARGNALRHLARNLDTGGAGTAVVVFNPSGWVRSGRVALPLDAALRRSRRLGLSRVVDAARRTAPVAFDPDSLSFFAREVPPLGAKVFWLERGPAAGGGPEAGPARLENAFLTVDIDTVRGRVRAVRHKAMGRDLLARGAGGNRLTPLGASDQGLPVERDRPAIEAARALRRGGDALERWIELEHPWGDGALVQRFTLRHGEPLLYIRGSLEGGPPGIVATFDLTVAGDSAWSELPYGAVALLTGGDAPARPMAHGRWTDQADAEFGVALLTDRPVTWDVRGPTVRFALTSDGATPTVDGVFHYALYAHAGDWRAGHAARRAAELAQPLLATRAASHGGAGGHAWSFLTLDAEHVSVGAVKRADVGRAVVVRLVEGEGRAGRVTLTSSRAMARVRAANLLEDPLAIVPLTSEHVVTLSLEPWEIRTLLIDELR
jgi:alpha-mannosidase